MSVPTNPRTGRVTRQLDARRRRETLAGSVVAGLGVVVAIVAVVALQHPDGYSNAAGTSKAPPPHASTSAHHSASAPVHPSSTVHSTTGGTGSSASPGPRPATLLPLVVVNNTGEPGLAARGAAAFEAGGWTVTLLDNLSQPTSPTCAYYDPGVANAQAVAQGLQRQFPAIKAVRPRFDGLPDGPIVVVLTPDYTG